MKDLIKKFVELTGPSGYESQVRLAVQAEVQPYADHIVTDALGNLIATKGAKSKNGLKIMLSAHMDEIGVIATHIDDSGFVRFTNIGGVAPRNCIGSRVRFLNGAQGVIGMEFNANRNFSPDLEELFIDLGAASRADCPVKVGDVAAFERPFVDLDKRMVAKAMDDRVSVAILIETLKQIKTTPHQLDFVFSVQEEVGLRGATTAAYGLDPDLGLAVDVTATGDTPKARKMAVELGGGPAVKVRDGGMLADPRVVDWMVKTAESARIPYQLEVLLGGTTDARSIQVARAGVPAGCLSVPTRYLHTPSEMVDTHDVLNSVRLLVALLSQPVAL